MSRPAPLQHSGQAKLFLSSCKDTVHLRVPEASRNAMAVAQFLEEQAGIAKVYYPGLPSHPQHETAKELFKFNDTRRAGHPVSMYGTLMSFELASGRDPLAFLNRLQTVILSSHLSDTRTLAIPVAQTIYWEMGLEKRVDMGIAEGLIRLSVGIESLDDLLEDFGQALTD